jgi:acyl-coenzyme A synthetase/AMP-(fatty) acid ligase
MESLINKSKIPEQKDILFSLESAYSYRDLYDSIERYTTLLGVHGSLKGKRIALLLPHYFSYISLMLAIRRLDGTVLGISCQYRKEDLTSILERLGPHIIFSIPDFGFDAIITEWAGRSNKDCFVYQTSDGMNWGQSHYEGSMRSLHEQRIEYMSCSSGSTGVPKGFAVPFNALDFSAAYIRDGASLSNEDRCMLLSTPTSVFGYACIFAGLWTGATMFVPEKLDMVKIVHAIEEQKINKILTTPSVFRSLYSFIARMKTKLLSSIELVGLTGEAVSTEFLSQFDLLTHSSFISLYGISETGGLMIGDLRTMKFKVYEGVSYKIADCDDSGSGELWVKTPGLFSHYYENPELTEESFSEDRWYLTGDIVRKSSDGMLELIGRKKDVIKKGGRQVIPQEVEQVLTMNPQVKESVVIGYDHGEYGEQIIAFVTVNNEVQETDLYSFCSEKLTHYKVPDRIVFVDHIPITQGKADKLTLKRLLNN